MSSGSVEPAVSGLCVAVEQLTKRFGSKRLGTVTAVQDLTFEVQPGRVTGFLGPNGAGKTTTLRILLGLVRPTSGRATIGGRLYRELDEPMREVGASLEATGFHSGRTASSHLRVLAAAAGVPDSRVPQVIEQIGLSDAADRRVGGFSLGMRQRLALAAALLGDPPVLLLDEPANGLDPEGIAWLRGFLRHLAGQGRTVLVSSHVLAEVQQTVDDVVIIARGRLIRQATLEELEGTAAVLVRTPTPEPLAAALAEAQLQVAPGDAAGMLRVSTADPALVGATAFAAGIELHELRREESDLESIFLTLTADEEPASRESRPSHSGSAAKPMEVSR
jgi:ABC-2 type transport system ATP-binding protein